MRCRLLCLYFSRIHCEAISTNVVYSTTMLSSVPSYVKLRLGIMMFVNYVVWCAWYVTITNYLTTALHFTGTQAGAVFGTASIAS
ncbi:MAG: hypothetical protein ABUS49_12315, partial [Acidobacteriota bacterium]